MTVAMVVTFSGPDEPGLVGAMSQTVAEHEANWEESRMARLAGHFAGILHITAPATQADALQKALTGLRKEGLTVAITVGTPETASGELRSLHLELVGQDRPGIVQEISALLSDMSINIEEMETSCRPAPHAGDMLFEAFARLLLPPEVDEEDLRVALETIANDLMVDIKLGDEEP